MGRVVMNNSIIFLDVDGVLNSRLKNLETILLATGAKIIVSSSWRFGGIGNGSDFSRWIKKTCKDNSNLATAQLILSRTIGTTAIPKLTESVDLYPTREQEILDVVKDKQILKWIAIDDEVAHFPSQPSWLVLCSVDVGLDDVKTAEAINKL
jgi:hypothetical protein